MSYDGRLDPASLFRRHARPRHDQHGRAARRSGAAFRPLRRSGRDRPLRRRGLGFRATSCGRPLAVADAEAIAPAVRRSAGIDRRAVSRRGRRRADRRARAGGIPARLRRGARRSRRAVGERRCAVRRAGAPLPFEAALAVSALSLLSGDTVCKKLKICPNCSWLFLDRSRNSSRLWCDMAVCGNRAEGEAALSPSKDGKGRKPMARKSLLPVIGLAAGRRGAWRLPRRGRRGRVFRDFRQAVRVQLPPGARPPISSRSSRCSRWTRARSRSPASRTRPAASRWWSARKSGRSSP